MMGDVEGATVTAKFVRTSHMCAFIEVGLKCENNYELLKWCYAEQVLE